MDIYEALYTTRAMRRMKPDPIPIDAQARILDAAIRAPNIGEGWRFILVDDAEIKARLASLYDRAWGQMFEAFGADRAAMLKMDGPAGRAARSGEHLAGHFAEVPLLLIGFGKSREGSGIYPAIWSAMLLRGIRASHFDRVDLVDMGAATSATAELVVAFSHPLCTDCHELISKLEGDGRRLVTVDVRERPELARKYGIALVPTAVVVSADGRVTARLAG